MISEKDYNDIYLKGYEDGKNDNNNLKINYEIKPSFTTRKLKQLQQENKQLKDFLGLLEVNIRINHDDIQINLYKKLLQIFKDLKDILGDKENE